MKLRIAAMTATLAALASCAEPSTKQAQPEPSKKVDVADIAPKAKVVYSYFHPEPFMRFVAEFENPSPDRTRVGVQVTWNAYDADGVIIDSDEWFTPPIPPSGSSLFVDGSGPDELDGQPEKVRVTIADKGQLVKDAPKPLVKVLKTSLVRDEPDEFVGSDDYAVSVVIEALTDVNGDDLNVDVVLRDANGKIIGAEWADEESFPERMKRGEKAKLSCVVTVGAGMPTKVEAHPSELPYEIGD